MSAKPQQESDVWDAPAENAKGSAVSAKPAAQASGPQEDGDKNGTAIGGGVTPTPNKPEIEPPPPMTAARLSRQFEIQTEAGRVTRLRTLAMRDLDTLWLLKQMALLLEKLHGRDWAKKQSDWSWLRDFAG